MKKGETLDLTEVSLIPDEISHIYFVKDGSNREFPEIVFKRINVAEYTIKPNEFQQIRQFAEINNLIDNTDIRSLG